MGVKLLNSNKVEQYTFYHDEDILIQFDLKINAFEKGMSLFVMVLDKFSNRVFPSEILMVEGTSNYLMTIQSPFLVRGKYSLECYLHIPKLKRFDTVSSVCHFEVLDNQVLTGQVLQGKIGVLVFA